MARLGDPGYSQHFLDEYMFVEAYSSHPYTYSSHVLPTHQSTRLGVGGIIHGVLTIGCELVVVCGVGMLNYVCLLLVICDCL